MGVQTECCNFQVNIPMKNSKLTLLFLMIVLRQSIFAQEVIASSGEFQENTEGSFSWTLGEIVTETFSQSNGIFTQGFQQDFEHILFVQKIPNTPSYSIYPNPFNEEIIISIHDFVSHDFSVSLYSLNGKLLQYCTMTPTFYSTTNTLKVDDLPNGIYFLDIHTSDLEKVKTFKLIKSTQ